MAFFPQYPNPQSQMGPGQGPISGADLDSGASPMMQPKMAYSPEPEQTPGAPEKPIKQPGYRRSIKEYLEEIKMLREQGQGVTPTFTNIQGGPMDVQQGQLGGEDVRSYVNPEYVQGDTGGLTRGEAHPVTQAQQGAYGQAGGEGDVVSSDWINDDWPNRRALQDSDEVIEALNQQMLQTQNREATPEEQVQALNQYRVKLYEQQAKLWGDVKKKYKDASTGEIMDAYKTGDFTKVAKAGENAFSEKSIKERSVDLGEEYLAYVKKEREVPYNEETGEPFSSVDEYVQYHLNEYEEMMTGILKTAGERSQEGQPGGTTGKSADPKLQAVLEKLPTKKGTDGKDYVTYEGRNYMIGA